MKPKSRILVFGDLHQAPNLDQIEQLILSARPDATVFLGDYFDQWHDHYEHAYLTAKWLKNSLQHQNRVHLWGNHDLPYAFPGLVHCPGYTADKQRAIQAVLDQSDWAKLKLFHFASGWLFTHAGVTSQYVPESLGVPTPAWLEREIRVAWERLQRQESHWIWAVGQARGGAFGFEVGGPLWCDFTHEFKPISGVNQMFGHTPDPAGRFRTMEVPGSQNWCVDVSSLLGMHKAALVVGDHVETLPF